MNKKTQIDTIDHSRRRFLGQCGSLATACAALSLGLNSRNSVASFGDYRALICVQLQGGNDGNNVIVPFDTSRYTAYQNLRGNLALKGNKLLPPISNMGDMDHPYALHYGLADIHDLFQMGNVAFVLNTGMLQQPLTRAQYLAGFGVPGNLFSHSDQTVQAYSGYPATNGTGWAGRLLDTSSVGDSLAAISVSVPSLFLQGLQVKANIVPAGSNLAIWGSNIWPQSAAAARLQAIQQIGAMASADPVVTTANQTLAEGVELSSILGGAAQLSPLETIFPATQIGNQLKEVLRLIRLRSALGPGRQVFFCTLGGFDTHSAQDWQHWNLLSQLSKALAAFFQATQEISLDQQVTAFTQSEFGRTLQPNGNGCDHGWGNHHIVLGGAVAGGIYGQMPVFQLGGQDDATNRGAWIPTISTAQYGATLGKWFGASAAELAAVFPNLGNFDSSPYGTDVGFMG